MVTAGNKDHLAISVKTRILQLRSRQIDHHEVHTHEMHACEVHAHEVHAMRYTPMKCTPVRYTPMRYTPETPTHHCFGGSLAQTVVNLSRSEFQNSSFCASREWSLLPSAIDQNRSLDIDNLLPKYRSLFSYGLLTLRFEKPGWPLTIRLRST